MDRAKSFEIETARLRLRPFAPEDLEAIYRLWLDPGISEYLWDDERVSRERAEAVLAGSVESFEGRSFGLWTAVRKKNREMIGFCGFRSVDDEIELLYGISTPQWGTEFATEAARAVIRYGFEEVGFDRILGITDTENLASRRVLEKIGMKFEKHVCREGRDETHYAIRREEFRPDDAFYLRPA